jgi:ParB-like chromosome segregation protein Spo0J
LRLDAEYNALLPPLSRPESEALKRSIQEDGLHYPIIVNKSGTVLDGHNRLNICRELGIKPRFEIRDFSNDRLREKKFVIVANLRRRHLNDFQRIELSQPLLILERRLAKQRMLHADKKGLPPNGSRGEAVENVAKEIGVSARTYYRALTVLEKESETVKSKLRTGRLEISAAYTALQSTQKRKALLEHSKKPLSNHVQLRCGDFRKVLRDIPDCSVDAIITDPPYARRFVRLATDIAAFASRVLKQGGSLFLMVGQSFLPDVYRQLPNTYPESGGRGLNYNWTLAPLMALNASTSIFPRKVLVSWKPVLWLVRGRFEGGWHYDTIEPDEPDKTIEEWQQSVKGTMKLIDRYTQPGDVILDPCMGTGTFGVAATELKRSFIGCDLDPEKVAIAHARIAEVDQHSTIQQASIRPSKRR